MKQFQINRAWAALSRIAEMQMPVRAAFQIYQLKKEFGVYFQRNLEFEKMLAEKHGGSVMPDGTVFFPAKGNSESDKQEAMRRTEAFRSEMAALAAEPVDIHVGQVCLKVGDLEGLRISAEDLSALEELLTIEEEGGAVCHSGGNDSPSTTLPVKPTS